MTVLTQVYGITTPEDAAMVNALGPDHVGVVLDEGIKTWDSVDERTLRAVLRELTGPVVVALSLATSVARIRQTVETVQPAIVHLARADGMSVDDLAAVRAAVSPVALMLTVPVRGPSAVVEAQRLAPLADWLLLDSADPSTGVVGATGLTHDWALSRAVVSAVDVPVFLAGGLGPDNVAAAIAAVRPAGVDSETRTSRADDRRRKDPELVRRFLAEARGGG
jgi:phosphoribosylanthranilate isomerase